MQPKADRIEIVKRRVIKCARVCARTTAIYRIQIAPTRGLSEIAKVRNRTHNGGSVRRSCAHAAHAHTRSQYTQARIRAYAQTLVSPGEHRDDKKHTSASVTSSPFLSFPLPPAITRPSSSLSSSVSVFHVPPPIAREERGVRMRMYAFSRALRLRALLARHVHTFGVYVTVAKRIQNIRCMWTTSRTMRCTLTRMAP